MEKLVTRKQWQRMLLIGLGCAALLLLSAVLVAFRTIHQINALTETFAERQALAKDSIDNIESEQSVLNERWRKLARSRDVVRREEILAQLDQNRQQMSSALESAYEQAELLRESIYQTGHGLLRWTVWLFALCVVLSLGGASWAVRNSALLFRRLEAQASDLAALQYAFLETQEQVARRFSHELHDELGQALAAVKANLSALRQSPDAARVEDCMALVDGAIHDVREISQLLRPTILDDFGLDAALRALTERFAQRTGIEVRYTSDIEGVRLRDEAETHLFRIAQEALTNVARHSGATVVDIGLHSRGEKVELSIKDNGRGRGQRTEAGARGLGLAGIEMRARGCGGESRISSEPGKGFAVAVSCPLS
ncbi:MAG TPA: sensor histidine kinase [Bryobacteraceae bacterium]|jgi:signal transduction histidine kinase|nr:sensor histidine kinase [Bryobacteraceae bacterium]